MSRDDIPYKHEAQASELNLILIHNDLLAYAACW